MFNFLVTGGAGFIGSHLVEKLLASAHHVRVLDNLSTGQRENLKEVEGRFEWCQADAADRDAVEKAMRGIDGVFHLAAVPSVRSAGENPLLNQRSGEMATLVVLDSACRAGVKRVVYSSSAAVYGDTEAPLINEQTPTRPISFYGLSKLASEGYCRLFSSHYPGLDTVSLRYFNVFGHRQSASSPYSGVIAIFMRCLLDKIPPTIFGDGRQTRDFIEVSEVVAANIVAMESKKALCGECFNVATGTSVSVLQLWDFFADMTGSNIGPQFAAARAEDIKHSRADISKLEQAFRWRPDQDWKAGLAKLWAAAKAEAQQAR
jgi:UDP-N-acetylglucosamine/UDP-N-acetyl-alpha-D-glucosaminouronate 4-epimerase